MAGRIAYYGNIVKDGLVLALDAAKKDSYPGSGTVWSDVSGNGNNGTLTNGPTFSSTNGGSVVFDGTNDFVLGTIPSTTFSSAHTISCWFYRRTIKQWSGLFSNNVNINSATLLTFIDNTNSIGINRAGISPTAIAIDLGADHLNKWIYCALVLNGVINGNAVNVYAYKDNSLLTSSGNLYWSINSTTSYYVGRHWAGDVQIHDGFIPSVQIYNRALSASEITQNYNALKGRYGL